MPLNDSPGRRMAAEFLAAMEDPARRRAIAASLVPKGAIIPTREQIKSCAGNLVQRGDPTGLDSGGVSNKRSRMFVAPERPLSVRAGLEHAPHD